MGKYSKLLSKIQHSVQTTGFNFNAICNLLVGLGFHQRI